METVATPLWYTFLSYLAIAIAAIGFGFLSGSRDRAGSMATFFFWTLPSQICIRLVRGVVAFFHAVIR